MIKSKFEVRAETVVLNKILDYLDSDDLIEELNNELQAGSEGHDIVEVIGEAIETHKRKLLNVRVMK